MQADGGEIYFFALIAVQMSCVLYSQCFVGYTHAHSSHAKCQFRGAIHVMPNIKSVIKDVKRSRLRQLRNQATKSQIKTYVKKSRNLIAAGTAQPEEVAASVSKTVSVIDKAWKRGIIHKNAAARRKSRLMKRAAAAAA